MPWSSVIEHNGVPTDQDSSTAAFAEAESAMGMRTGVKSPEAA
jgi:hypothetical protein